ncbi:hypothetical protein BBJ29_002486 [Phytophthora kernoviae]|uniref:Uncharacterized protein n=1 Tax=Phytophthora kernoviae TaxID=325452 RepID=A0A3F2RP41_9STRA|nr:hypothetical protein BBJ29_002486 [Phytophthora kernoviae]RLN61513.1 hypothetical protein BBP00_00005345 [Phytophthora kernoviae]
MALDSRHSPVLQLTVHEEEPTDGPEQFEFHKSFGFMTGRRLQRRYRGVYKKDSFMTQLVTWVIVAYVVVIFGILSADDSSATENASVSDGVFYFAIIAIGIYILVKVALIVRWIIYWIIFAELLTYAITSNLYVLFWVDDNKVSDSDLKVRRIMVTLLVVAEVVTICVYWFTHYAYPWLVLREKFNLVTWWNVKPGVETNTLTYRSKARFYSRKCNVIKYCGGLNAEGRPHGYGMWSDTDYHGERLTGQWANGIPIGPFRSFEHGSGYSFVNIRIGFCHNRSEQGSTEISFFPKHSENGLNWGVASVECSVSGGFFREDDKEALVLLHGYNCSLDYGMNRLAQLLALGDFPSYIHPFVFSWPSGGVLAYWPAKNTGSESERTAHDFIQFVKSLIDAGYTKLNIIGHSMGARIFFSCLQKGLFDEVFLPTGSNADIRTATGKLELSTLTFCNPDYEQNEFAKYGGSYDRARHFCSHITLYADNLDGALFYIEYLSMTSLKGPLNYSLGRRGHMMYRNKEDSVVVGQPDTQRRNWQEKNLSAPQDLNLAFAAVNESGNYPGVTSYAYNRNRTHPTTDESSPYGTNRSGDGEEEPLHYLDMDVIDTTWMDNNVHAIRHNYFNLNPTIVDDLRHLIVLKKRASSRPGLLKTTSAENVYIFLVAPSHVKNK